MKRLLYETKCKTYRIYQEDDFCYDLDDLKGDCFNPLVNPDISPEKLKEEESQFETKVHNEGVYGFILERWNTQVGVGYEQVDACWGFVGQYNPKIDEFNHYIVDELFDQIPTEFKEENEIILNLH